MQDSSTFGGDWCQTKTRLNLFIDKALQFTCKYISRHIINSYYTWIDQAPKEKLQNMNLFSCYVCTPSLQTTVTTYVFKKFIIGFLIIR